jgi:hypothetical protein
MLFKTIYTDHPKVKDRRMLFFVTWQLKGQNNGARMNCLLLGNSSINAYHADGYTRDNRGTVGNSGFYVVHPEAI